MSGFVRFHCQNVNGEAVLECLPSFQCALDELLDHFPEFIRTLRRILSTQERYLAHVRTFSLPLFSERFPEQAELYKVLRTAWASVIAATKRYPGVRTFCVDDDSLSLLASANEACALLDNGVIRALHQARETFPPFFSLADRTLVEFLSSPMKTSKDMPSLTSIFGFDSLVYETAKPTPKRGVEETAEPGVARYVVGVRGRDEEIFFFDSRIRILDNVAKLFDQIQSQIKISLRETLKRALETTSLLNVEKPLDPEIVAKRILLCHPTQIAVLMLRLRFCAVIEQALGKGPVGLKKIAEDEEKLYRIFATHLRQHRRELAANGGVSADGKNIVGCITLLSSLVATQLRNWDIVLKLVEENTEAPDAPTWRRQLRYYWSTVRETVLVGYYGIDVDYGFEYQDHAGDEALAEPWTGDESLDQIFNCYRISEITSLVAPSAQATPAISRSLRALALSLGRTCLRFVVPSVIPRPPPYMAGASATDKEEEKATGNDTVLLANLAIAAITSGRWLIIEGAERSPPDERAILRTLLDRYTKRIAKSRRKADIFDDDATPTMSFRIRYSRMPNARQRAQMMVFPTILTILLPQIISDILPMSRRSRPGSSSLFGSAQFDRSISEISDSETEQQSEASAELPSYVKAGTTGSMKFASECPPNSYVFAQLSNCGFSEVVARRAGRCVAMLLPALSTPQNPMKPTPACISITAELCRIIGIAAHHFHHNGGKSLLEEEAVCVALFTVLTPRIDLHASAVLRQRLLEFYPAVSLYSAFNKAIGSIGTTCDAALNHHRLVQPGPPPPPLGSTLITAKKGWKATKEAAENEAPPPDPEIADTFGFRLSCIAYTFQAFGSIEDDPNFRGLPPPSMWIVSGRQGFGKTTAMHALRRACAVLSFDNARMPCNDTKINQVVSSNLASLTLNPETTVMDLLGTMNASIATFQDGPLAILLRGAIAKTSPSTDVDTSAPTHSRNTHVWIWIRGLCNEEVAHTLYAASCWHSVTLESGEVLQLNPRIHFVYEVCTDELLVLPPLLTTTSLLFYIDDGHRTMVPAPLDLRAKRPFYLRGDVSGALLTEAELRAEFDRIDMHGRGYIDMKTVQAMMPEYDLFGQRSDLFSEAGLLKPSQDRLNYDEFALLMLRLAKR